MAYPVRNPNPLPAISRWLSFDGRKVLMPPNPIREEGAGFSPQWPHASRASTPALPPLAYAFVVIVVLERVAGGDN